MAPVGTRWYAPVRPRPPASTGTKCAKFRHRHSATGHRLPQLRRRDRSISGRRPKGADVSQRSDGDAAGAATARDWDDLTCVESQASIAVPSPGSRPPHTRTPLPALTAARMPATRETTPCPPSSRPPRPATASTRPLTRPSPTASSTSCCGGSRSTSPSNTNAARTATAPTYAAPANAVRAPPPDRPSERCTWHDADQRQHRPPHPATHRPATSRRPPSAEPRSHARTSAASPAGSPAPPPPPTAGGHTTTSRSAYPAPPSPRRDATAAVRRPDPALDRAAHHGLRGHFVDPTLDPTALRRRGRDRVKPEHSGTCSQGAHLPRSDQLRHGTPCRVSRCRRKEQLPDRLP